MSWKDADILTKARLAHKDGLINDATLTKIVEEILTTLPANWQGQTAVTAQNAYGGGGYGGMEAPPYQPIEKLMMRLGFRDSSQSGFNFLAAVDNSEKGNVVVFLITKTGEALHVEDDRALFPTDGLVSRLNILRG